MFNTLLFDLDGTLLDLDTDYFLKFYFQSMIKYALEWDYSEGAYLVEQIWKATEAMVGNLDPGRTNEEVFMSAFLPNFDCDSARILSFFESFYARHFPALKSHCQPYPSIPGILEEVFSKGYTVIIATNPVFPMPAVMERLKWAGVEQFPFKLVTAYENMHFCKPQPQYYQEIADRAGVPASSCLMIGNDTREDLVAGTIGMKTFLLKDGLLDRGDGYPCDWQGYLPDLEGFIKSLPAV